jgi:hypothetical protein
MRHELWWGDLQWEHQVVHQPSYQSGAHKLGMVDRGDWEHCLVLAEVDELDFFEVDAGYVPVLQRCQCFDPEQLDLA